MAKKITIERLAEMIQDGFSEVHKKLRDHDMRFDNLEKRMDSLEKRMEILEKGICNLDERVSSMEEKLDSFESRFYSELASVRSEMREIRIKLAQIEETLEKVSRRTMEDNDALSDEYLKLNKRVTILEKKYKELCTQS